MTGSEFMEPSVPYTFDVLLTLDVSQERIFEVPLRFDGYSDLDPAPPSDFFDEESSFDLIMVRPVYDESKIPAFSTDNSPLSEKSSSMTLIFGISIGFILLIILVATTFWMRTKQEEIVEAELQSMDSED